jgi:hypothetical protein
LLYHCVRLFWLEGLDVVGLLDEFTDSSVLNSLSSSD